MFFFTERLHSREIKMEYCSEDDMVECQQCLTLFAVVCEDGDLEANYCPNCGADLDCDEE
jgi:uncharacterized paraquat-inducible protein A